MDRVRVEQAERVAVRAVLLEPAGVRAPLGDVTPALQNDVPARWVGAGGVEVSGLVPVGVGHAAGDEVRVWLDRAGAVVPPPSTAVAATVAGWVLGCVAAMVGWTAVVFAWFGIRRATASRNAAMWARGWERVEPTWSGRVP